MANWQIPLVRPVEVGRGETQIMLPPMNEEYQVAGDVCLLAESPYRILRAAENGDAEDFSRLYFNKPSRLYTVDLRGRTCIHQAASRDNTNILTMINNVGGDFNVIDNFGDTPLHLAVKNACLMAVHFLLERYQNCMLLSGVILKNINRDVKTDILNKKSQAPIHIATELNLVSVLKVFVEFKALIDVHQRGEHGRTPLHIAAIHDFDDCARVLIYELGAEPNRPCNNGFYAIHEAAKNASSRTIEVFLEWGESLGQSREEMINYYDSEGNVPLHSAVHSSDKKAVELCLKSGARISTQQHDLSTPVHLACSQGALDIIKLMFEMQPNEKMACLKSCDVQKMTPLHCAAMFGHSHVVEFLVNEGSDINVMDRESRTPLLLAASRSGWKTVHRLIQLGANIEVTDYNNRNIIHLVVMHGGNLQEFTNACPESLEKTIKRLLDEKDKNGCTPLHHACSGGRMASVRTLISLGAIVNMRNTDDITPLHFAAKYGRLNIVNSLLQSEKGTFIINESDGRGLTPLHIASVHGHTRVVQELLSHGALLHRDHNGRNPLHLAAMEGYTDTIELLYSVHSHMLNQMDKDGNTPLHLATMENKPHSVALLLSMGCHLNYNHEEMSAIDYAIYFKFSESALAMVTHDLRSTEVMALRSERYPCVTLALIACMPRVFEAVQDRCITKANCKKDSKSFYIKYNFEILSYNHMRSVVGKLDNKTENYDTPLPALNIKYSFKFYEHSTLEIDALRLKYNDPKFRPEPLSVINAMVRHNRVELLAHPLSQKYLQTKWNAYGKYFHMTHLVLYSLYLFWITVFTLYLVGNKTLTVLNEQLDELHPNRTVNSKFRKFEEHEIDPCALIIVASIWIVTYNVINCLRELYNFSQQMWQYLNFANLMTWVLYGTATVMVIPVLPYSLRFSTASIAVFLAWFGLLLLLRRFDRIGIYVVMFLEILQTLMRVLCVFSILFIAFGLAFFILMSQGNHLSFRTIPIALLRTFAMMLGEIDFIGTYVEPYFDPRARMLPFASATFFILAVFMVLMPILLMNLLIGLAVGDIESVKRNAKLKRLAMQVVLHTELEQKLPASILARVDRPVVFEYPNEVNCQSGFFDRIFRNWFCTTFNEDNGLDIVLDDNNEHYYKEVQESKQQLHQVKQMLDSQSKVISLIAKKLEIHTEADDMDEGVGPEAENRTLPRWKSPLLKRRLRKQYSRTI